MRTRINKNDLLEKLKQGKTQKEIAADLNVSPAAICKRLKRLLPPPPSLTNLTVKQQKFCMEVSKGQTATQAALNSYDAGSRESAKVIGSQLLAEPDIKMAIQDLMDHHGLTRSYRVQRLKNHVDHRDPIVSLKALDMTFKLDGGYKPEDLVSSRKLFCMTVIEAHRLSPKHHEADSDETDPADDEVAD